jgi:hypothetical protein
MVLYICNKCNKEFNNKHNYVYHINRKNPCILEDNTIKLEINKYLDEINQLKEKNKLLEDNNKKLEEKNIELESQNKILNNLVDKCIVNNKTKNNNCNNNNNNNNTTNNTININLVPFGMENLDDLTLEEKKSIVNAGLYCSVICTKKINCNPRLPQYHNISYTNLRSNDAKIFDKDKTWKTVDKEDFFETIMPRRIDDVNIIIENEDIKVSSYINNLLEKGTDEDKVLNDNKIKKKFHRTIYDFNKSKKTINN